MRTTTRTKTGRRSAAPAYEIHAHASAVQIHDGTQETPLAVMLSPRGDPRALAILAAGLADATGWKLRAFTPEGIEL